MLIVVVLRGTKAVSGAAVVRAVIYDILIAILAGCTCAPAVVSIVSVPAVVIAVAVAVPARVTVSVAITVSITVPITISVSVTVSITVAIAVLVSTPAALLVLISPALTLIRDGLLGLRTGKGRASDGQSGGDNQHSQSFHKITPSFVRPPSAISLLRLVR